MPSHVALRCELLGGTSFAQKCGGDCVAKSPVSLAGETGLNYLLSVFEAINEISRKLWRTSLRISILITSEEGIATA